jgi:hypothetical protein
MVVALGTVLLAFVVPATSGISYLQVVLFATTFLTIALVAAFSPYMGKREFLRRYGSVPKYWSAYFKQQPWWVLLGHIIPCAIGILAITFSMVVVRQGSVLLDLHGRYFLLAPSGVERTLTKVEYGIDSSALQVFGPGVVLVMQAVILAFLCADRFLRARPELWPPARDRHYSNWFRIFSRN